jgi:hypothetical protein
MILPQVQAAIRLTTVLYRTMCFKETRLAIYGAFQNFGPLSPLHNMQKKI